MAYEATYSDGDTFTVTGTKANEFLPGRRVRANCGADGFKYGTVSSSTESGGTTTVNFASGSSTLTANLSAVDYSVIAPKGLGAIPDHQHSTVAGEGGNTFVTVNLTGGQIAFPVTQNASADANTLDDYEEGTWTLTITPATSGTVTLDSSFDLCSYVKIGSVVHTQGYIAIASLSSPVGNLQFSLPFTSASLGELAGTSVGSVSVANLDRAASSYLVANVGEGVTYFDIREVIDASALDIIEGSDLGGTETFQFQITYRMA